jgi:hypothetical protein
MMRTTILVAIVLLTACGGGRDGGVQTAPGAAGSVAVEVARVRSGLTALAHDTMEGRMTGSVGAARAARFIAAQYREIGLEPAGDSAGYFQRVPLARLTEGRRPFAVLFDAAAADTIAPERRQNDVNVIGLIRGSDPLLRDEYVVVGAHYDHVGIRPHPSGDSIFNGADDDASGVIAVIEIARALAHGPAPARTVVFAAFTGEEVGGLGSRYYLEHPVGPLESTVAQLQIEMIGRPDSLAGGHGRGWLTGYERSTMGDMLAENGVPIVPDPRPEQNFFMRSDNIAFARRGIPAHTLSSFNLHTDYHQPSDDASRVDFEHMTAVIEAAIYAVRLLADGPAPAWHPDGRPD